MKRSLCCIALTLTVAAAAQAQPAGTAAATQRDANQQGRIEQGLQSGELSTREAGRLEREQQAVDRQQAHALKDGTLTPREQARISREQNAVSRDVYTQKHDAQKGNPASASSRRMQADVQRNANQQQRIANGVRNGSLTNHEAASLERGQSHVDRREARAGADGHVGAAEQHAIARADNRQSARIYNKKHNARVKG